MTSAKDHHFRQLDDGFDDYIHSKTNYRASATDDRVYTSKWRMKIRALVLGIIFYSRLCVNEIKKKLFNFVIGAASITITVFVAATISTIVDNAPFVILKQAENSCGQYDIAITPRNGPYINYTLVKETLSKQSESETIAKLSASRYLFNNTQARFFTPQCIDTIDSNNTENLCDPTSCKLSFEDTGKCQPHSSSLWIIDLEQEQLMQFGSSYPQQLIPGKGEVVVNKKQMAAFNIQVGDTLLLSIDLDDGSQQSLLYSFIKSEIGRNANHKTHQEAMRAANSECSRILIEVKVIAILDEISFGKFGSDMNLFTFIMDNKHFMTHLHEHSNDALHNPIFDNLWSPLSLQQLSTHIFFKLPHRIKYFLTLNYNVIQRQFAVHASNIVFFLGYTQIDVATPIESQFFDLRYGALFFQLILDVILMTLCVFSFMLLYSLLIISVETRTFELGILRMIGMNRKSLIKLLLHQSLFFSLPSWICGLLLSEFAIFWLLTHFSDVIGYKIHPFVSNNGLIRATAVGLLVPLISSILPIKNALSKNLSNNNTQRKAEKINLVRSEQSEMSKSALIIGTFCVVFGFCVYYIFPLALITQRLSLLLAMLFVLMISMLVGLLLLSFSIQHLVERALIFLFFAWFEKRHIRHIILKNMQSHKHRNKKTALMYSASLGFVIMISVVYRVQIGSIGLTMLAHHGGKLFVKFSRSQHWRYEEMEHQFADTISDVTYRWMKSTHFGSTEVESFHFSKIIGTKVGASIVSPDYMNVAERELFSSFANTVSEELYSAKGSQAVIVGGALQKFLNLKSLNPFILKFSSEHYQSVNALDYISVYPGYQELGQKLVMITKAHELAMSMPSFLRWQQITEEESDNLSVEDLANERIGGMLIKVWPNATAEGLEKMNQYIHEFGVNSFNFDDFMEVQQSTNSIMDIVFSAATYISLFLCLFSVISSMYINIYEQSKEVAVLRAIGLCKYETYKVYLYEAVVLISSSCIMGIGIGALVGFTMTAQIALYASYPIKFDMPYKLLIIILIASFISAAISVIVPLVQLLSKTVSHVIRVNFK